METKTDEADEVGSLLADSAERFLRSHHGPARSRLVRMQGDGGGDSDFWRGIAEQGWLALRLPEQLSGTGLPLRPALALARAFGAHAVPDPIIACGLLPGAVVALLPDPAIAAGLGDRLARGEGRVALAWQTHMGQVEPELGALRATIDGAAVKLGGSAVCVPRPVETLLVLATADGEPVLVQTAAEAGGTAWEDVPLSDGSLFGRATFDDVPGQLLCRGEPALEAVRLALAEATIASSALLEGLASQAFAMTVAYCKQRVQFGLPLTEQQVLQHRLVDYSMQLMLSAASWRKAARGYEADPAGDATRRAVHACKARCSETALTVTRGAIQLHGAMGYTEEADIGIYLRAALRHSASFGNAAAHRARFLAIAEVEQVR